MPRVKKRSIGEWVGLVLGAIIGPIIPLVVIGTAVTALLLFRPLLNAVDVLPWGPIALIVDVIVGLVALRISWWMFTSSEN